MSLRTFSILLSLSIAACGGAEQENGYAAEQRQVEAAPKFFCAQGAAELVAQCTAERNRTTQGWALTLRHPDGHFRRLLVSDDGQTITAADGAQPAGVVRSDGAVEVTIAGDRYRLPTLP